MPPSMFRGIGKASDALSSVLPLGSGFSYEAAQLITAAIPTDDTATLRELDLSWRSPADAIIATFAASSPAAGRHSKWPVTTGRANCPLEPPIPALVQP